MNALTLDGVVVRFGGVDALGGVSLRVDPGSIVGLIGPNGAGKTTLVNATTGMVPLAGGSVVLGGARLDGLRPFAIARRGVARTYQNIRLFGALSVQDNIRAGAIRRHDT
ncbi:MAG: ATP-binding cassette domain-containing protein, partial [Candidatus Eremiobacteraeota bacterium]|nr:ATP-binding cassette domain-containing protein [Candidatus Eremiobacteraeota bacterium]